MPSGWSFTSCATIALLALSRFSDALSLPSHWDEQTKLRAESFVRRRSNNVTAPSAISISPSEYWEGNDGPWSSFPLQVGGGNVGGLQNVRVMPSTAATGIWTIGPEGCPNDYVANCPVLRGGLFMTNQSLTWLPQSIYETGLESNLGLDSSGYVGYDTATLGWEGSGGPTDNHSIIWNLADSNYWIGVFGLNPRPTNFTTFADPQTGFMQTIFDNDVIPSVSYGYTAGAPYRLDKVLGSLTLGGYDSSRFISNNVTFEFYQDISRDLSVNLQSVTTDKGSPSNLLPDGSISIFIDSTVPEIWLPESACQAFEQAFGIKYNDDYQRYTITSQQRQDLLRQNAQVTFTLGPSMTGGQTVDITLPYQAFDLQLKFPIVPQNGTYYYFPLQRAANSTQYTLGRTFLQEAYLIADYGRSNFSVSQCNWNQEEVSNEALVSITSLTGNSNSEDTLFLSNGVIAGIAIAGVGLIAVLALALYLLRRRRNKQKRRLAEEEAKEAAVAAQHADTKAMIGAPMGGELGGGDIHEMNVPNTAYAHEMETQYKRDPSGHGYNEMEDGGKGPYDYATEVPGSMPVFELPGNDVHEMPTPERRLSEQQDRREWI